MLFRSRFPPVGGAASTYLVDGKSGTAITTGNLQDITAVGELTSGSIGHGFGDIWAESMSAGAGHFRSGLTVKGTTLVKGGMGDMEFQEQVVVTGGLQMGTFVWEVSEGSNGTLQLTNDGEDVMSVRREHFQEGHSSTVRISTLQTSNLQLDSGSITSDTDLVLAPATGELLVSPGNGHDARLVLEPSDDSDPRDSKLVLDAGGPVSYSLAAVAEEESRRGSLMLRSHRGDTTEDVMELTKDGDILLTAQIGRAHV